MKKIVIFSSLIVVLFVALAIINNVQKDKKIEEYSLYNKDDLAPETIALLDNPNYQNLILPEQLDEKLQNKETVTVYFYGSDCQYCMDSTPRLVELSDELSIDIPQFNLTEFPDGWEKYNIEYTPTVVQYVNGEETARVIGAATKEEFKQWLEQNSL